MIAFLAGVAFLFYVVAGYPLALGWLARRRGLPEKRPIVPSLSILVPVHNGAPFIAAKLDSILALDYPRDRVEILIVSDGCTDGTDEIVRLNYPGLKLLRVPRGGKAAAINAGVAQLHNEIVVLTDVRQRLAVESVRNLVALFADPSVGVVSGELLIVRGESNEEVDIGRYWRYESWIRRQLGRVDSMMGATGPFYAIRRELIVPLPVETLLDDVYLPLVAFFRGYRLVVEETARAYDYPTALQSEFRRKVRTLAGNYQLLGMFPALLLPWRNRMWFHYVSYKLGRLLMPYALATVAVASFWLPQPWLTLAVSGQAAFYGLALADLVIRPGWPGKPVSSLARTFVVMMAAAVCATSVLFVQPQTLWKQTKVRLP